MKIVVDPGHGGRDPGAVAHGLREKDVAMMYGDGLAAELRRRMIDTLLTRDADEDLAPEATWRNPGKGLDLERRCTIANDFGANAFVSLHCNAGRAAANGAWVLYAKPSKHGKGLARRIFDELAKVPGIPDADGVREVYSDASAATGYTRRANALLESKPAGVDPAEWLYTMGLPADEWYRTIRVLRGTKMPAVLVELGFLTNVDDARQLALPSTIAPVVRAIAEGIEGWWSGD